MSLHQDLKQIDDILRARMNRRDNLSKHVRKHHANIKHWTHQQGKLDKRLQELEETTRRRIANLTDDIEKEEHTLAKAETLRDTAEKEVNERLEELAAL